jgi:hypothetical protein
MVITKTEPLPRSESGEKIIPWQKRPCLPKEAHSAPFDTRTHSFEKRAVLRSSSASATCATCTGSI